MEGGGSDEVRRQLEATREMVGADPVRALEMLLSTARQAGGEGAVREVLIQARRMKERKQEEQEEQREVVARVALEELVRDTDSILFQRGKEQILSDAFTDGSSVVCSKCGGLIKRDRWENHVMYWCGVGDDDDDENGMEVDGASASASASASSSSAAKSMMKGKKELEEGIICPKCDQLVKPGGLHLCLADVY